MQLDVSVFQLPLRHEGQALLSVQGEHVLDDAAFS
jgi:hypothetical protein